MVWALAILLVVAGFAGIILLGILALATFFVDLATVTLGMKRRGMTKAAIGSPSSVSSSDCPG